MSSASFSYISIKQGVPKHYPLKCDAVLTYVNTTMFLWNVGTAFIGLHGATYQKTVFYTIATITSNPA
jgi:hypothetical protein